MAVELIPATREIAMMNKLAAALLNPNAPSPQADDNGAIVR